MMRNRYEGDVRALKQWRGDLVEKYEKAKEAYKSALEEVRPLPTLGYPCMTAIYLQYSCAHSIASVSGPGTPCKTTKD